VEHVKRRTAIRADFGLETGEAADVEEDVAAASPGGAVAAVAVLGFSVFLAVLPALIAFGIARETLAPVAAGLASLVVVWGGVKLAAVIVGAARFASSRRGPVAAARFE
jgi:hypothetical protein